MNSLQDKLTITQEQAFARTVREVLQIMDRPATALEILTVLEADGEHVNAGLLYDTLHRMRELGDVEMTEAPPSFRWQAVTPHLCAEASLAKKEA